MSELPDHICITEEGPREGFQIEPGPVATADKVKLISALADTGLSAIQVCSFVSPRLVPGWADADSVVSELVKRDDVRYTALWFNEKGLQRAINHKAVLSLNGTIHTVASEAFCQSNLHRSREQNRVAMLAQTQAHQTAGIHITKVSVMAAFGCNFAGDITAADTIGAVEQGMSIAQACAEQITEIALADTMGWANPRSIERVVSEVRHLWPDVAIRLHLHDTRGLGIANAYAGLQCGVSRFDTTVGGLGGCPFAAKRNGCNNTGNIAGSARLPPGNIATEELVLLASELGIHTGVDLDHLIEAGRLAESIVGHALPSAALLGGSLSGYRA